MRSPIVALALLTLAMLSACGAEEAVDAAPSAPAEPAPEPVDSWAGQAAQVQADVHAMVVALYAGDVDTTLQFTYPAALEMLGGEAQARAMLEPFYAEMAARGVQLTSLTFPSPPTFLTAGANEHAIVPTLTVVRTGEQLVESLNFQFGARAAGETRWTYLEGSRVNQQSVRSFFPDFPADFEFPETYREQL
jgi:hypothetical protein